MWFPFVKYCIRSNNFSEPCQFVSATPLPLRLNCPHCPTNQEAETIVKPLAGNLHIQQALEVGWLSTWLSGSGCCSL